MRSQVVGGGLHGYFRANDWLIMNMIMDESDRCGVKWWGVVFAETRETRDERADAGYVVDVMVRL